MDIINKDLEELDIVRLGYKNPDVAILIHSDRVVTLAIRPKINQQFMHNAIMYRTIKGEPTIATNIIRIFIIKQGNHFSDKSVGSTCPESFNKELNIDVGKLTGYYGKTTLSYENENTLRNNSHKA